MTYWTIELVLTDVGPEGKILSGRRENWLWRIYEGSDEYDAEAREQMYKLGEYIIGFASGRTYHKPRRIRQKALEEAKRVCEMEDRARKNEVREAVGYEAGKSS